MRRWIMVGLGVLVVVVIAGVVWIATLQPVEFGSSTGVGRALLLGTDTDVHDDGVSDGVDEILTYRYVPRDRFMVLITLRNTSPLPVTIDGAGQRPQDAEGTLGFWLEDLAAENQSGAIGDDTGVLDQPPLPPTTIKPGDELRVWARFRIGACHGDLPWPPAPDWPEGELAFTSTDQLRIRTQVFGIPQTTTVPLPMEIRMINGGPEALLACPGEA